MATRRAPKSASKSGARRATPVEATKHVAARRKNIPTAELEAFAREAEKSPETMLYRREPSLDPQLVWKGKDQQDRQDLAVPVVPIYIQEKIAPRAIIENLRAERRAASEPQLDLFGDFNGLEFEQLIEFYQHSQHWSNRMILGDSLQVMASLAEKEGLKGQIQMIYMDPPYGIKFGSNWQVSTRKRDIVDGRAQDMSREPEQVRAFRDTWHMGIHSYLAFLRDRLVTARELLTETGSIFVQIGEENLHLVRCLLDEVMGRENFVSVITFSKTAGATTELLPGVADYIVWYARDSSRAKYRRLFTEKIVGGPGAGKYDQVELPDGSRRSLGAEERTDSLLPGARVFRLDNLTSQSVGREKGEGAASWFPVRLEQREFTPTMRSRWKTNEAGMANLLAANRVAITGNTLSYVRFIEDFPAFPITNIWLDIGGIQSRADPKVYVVQTATTAIERCVLMTTDPGDLVLDPTSGSGTTAHVAEQWGRRWIAIDTSRVALAIARTRLMAARYPYYILRDSSQGLVKEAQVTSTVPPSPLPPTAGDIRQGFVYERVPHVTLKSIATNPDLHEGMTREEVERSIARHAEAETLFDRPYIDSRIVRVTGPFTVESLSPHRLLPDEPGVLPDGDPASFIQMILGNLGKAGVQNTVKRERLVFDRLEPWPGGRYVQATGGYTENGKSKTAAIAIGPEYGTVGPEFVREAAKEAIRFADLLVVCGFAFEAHVGEESGQLGRLTILKAKMNPDLAMGEELLKKTGSGNLFMVFGEPDIAIESTPDDRRTTEIRGVDVFDPTMGVIRGHSTDDIAAWFLDTNYNGESFFVRHAYFLGADDPYDNLQRALRADIDEAAWQSLHSTKSRPFPRPATGKIAVKVINHYGDEVLKVYGIE